MVGPGSVCGGPGWCLRGHPPWQDALTSPRSPPEFVLHADRWTLSLAACDGEIGRIPGGKESGRTSSSSPVFRKDCSENYLWPSG